MVSSGVCNKMRFDLSQSVPLVNETTPLSSWIWFLRWYCFQVYHIYLIVSILIVVQWHYFQRTWKTKQSHVRQVDNSTNWWEARWEESKKRL